MEQINWRISPAATLVKYLFVSHTEPEVLPPEWQPVLPQILQNAEKMEIAPTQLSNACQFIDALEPLVSSNRLPLIYEGIAKPVIEQITNEVSLRTSQLKHHWMVCGQKYLELLEDCCPLFNFVILDLWTTIPIKQGSVPTASVLLGNRYSAGLFAASLHDSNPFIPEVVRPAYVATYFAIKAQLPQDLNLSVFQQHLSLASCRLALSLGHETGLNLVDRDSFQTAVELWNGIPAIDLTNELWELSSGIDQRSELTQFCLNWILQAKSEELP